MQSKSHETLKWIMRAGYSARGVIYVMMGFLAFWAAFSSGSAKGKNGTLAYVETVPMGTVAVWCIALGFLAYMVWRVVAGVADVDDNGQDANGMIARAGQTITGLIHGAVGVSILRRLMFNAESGGGMESWTQYVLLLPGGQIMIGIGAAILAGAGGYYAYKGFTSTYRDHLKSARFVRGADPVIKTGLILYGVLLVLVALSFGHAALTAEASQSGGMGEALQSLRGMIFGRFLLATAGLGLMAFALYNFVEAGFRVVPRIDGPDVETLRRAMR